MLFPEPNIAEAPLSVTEVTQQIKALVEGAFPTLHVVGEVSGLSRPRSGHVYFSLKDDGAILPAVIWKSSAMRMRFELQDGMNVIAVGHLGVYEPQGRYQFYVERLIAHGEGALDRAFRQLKERLFVKGYFAPEHKKPLPKYPQTIGVVTSASGEAIRDILKTLHNRWPAVEIVLRPVRVQGVGAAEEIAEAIALLNDLGASGDVCCDVLIVGRGGGSVEDLWAFNEEIVADAIHFSKLPIVSAVGHEGDITIADLVADARAATPTAAATMVVPDRCDELAGLNVEWNRLQVSMARRIEQARRQIGDLRQRRPFRFPLERLLNHSFRLDDLSDRLHRRRPHARVCELHERLALMRERLGRTIRRKAERDRERLSAIQGRLRALSPLNVLDRGYSLTMTADGKVLRATDHLRPGERLQTRLARGKLLSRVESVELEPHQEAGHE
jgi:exodeoxyribonuclease VII large subunit